MSALHPAVAALPPWLARMLTFVLAGVFALPACTLLLWQDDRSLASTQIATADLRAYRDPTVRDALFLHLPAETVRQLREHAPELPPDLVWLRLSLAAADAAQRLDDACRDEDPVTLDFTLYRDAPGTAPFWSVGPHRWPQYWGKPQWHARHAAAAATATVLTAPPARLGAPLPGMRLDYATCNDDGTPVLTRIALTPLALVGDTVLAGCFVVAVVVAIPLAPIGWLMQQAAGGDK